MEICEEYLSKFTLFLRKGSCPNEYMNSWTKLDETSLPSRKSFYSNLKTDNVIEPDQNRQ